MTLSHILAGPRQRWVAIALAVAVIALGACFFCDLCTLYVKHRLQTAASAEEEVAACRLLNHWGNSWAHGYAVAAEDAHGLPIRPHIDGHYDRVASVQITWHNGTKVRRRITDRSSLSYVFGE